MNHTNQFTLLLEHCKNPDIAHDERRGYWQPPQSPRKQRVQCDDLPQARDKFLAWILRDGLGAGNLTRMCGTVLDGKIKVGRFSYNGRLWDDAGNEITGFKKVETPAPAAKITKGMRVRIQQKGHDYDGHHGMVEGVEYGDDEVGSAIVMIDAVFIRTVVFTNRLVSSFAPVALRHIMTEDGYKFHEQEDGSWCDSVNDMSWESFEDMTQHFKDNGGITFTWLNGAPDAPAPAAPPIITAMQKNPLLQSLIWCVVALEEPDKITPKAKAEILEEANRLILANA